jgi:formylglycine-generating enzyme required for sulfatase activity
LYFVKYKLILYIFICFYQFSIVLLTYKVTKIEGNAFDTWSYSLTSVIIPDSVIVIGGYAFNRCTTLTSVTIPESVTSIGVFAFCRCTGLTSVTIPNRVTEIGSGAFDGCTGLTSVTIPNRVTKISGAFEGCTGLTSVIAPKGLDCDSAFEKCSSLANITFVDSVSPADQESEEAYVIDPEEEEEDKKESDADDDAYNADDDLGRDISKPLDKKLTRICIDVRKNGNLSFFLEDTRFKLIKVQGGTFKMGVQDDDESAPNYSENAYTDDSTVHDVTLSDFYIGQVPVTIGIWQKVMGYRSSFSESYEKRKEAFCDEDDLDVFGSIYNRPIDGVNWYDCLNFCNRLSIYFGLKPYYNIEIVKLKKWKGKNAPFIQSIENANVSFNDDANGFRLPTEAQWEFAARGGIKTSHFYDYSGSNDIEKVAVYDSCFDCPADVAQLAPNILGLYDMSGNVSEWCQDDYLPYTANPATDPLVLGKDCEKVIRGGSWCSYDNTYCMSTVRCSHDPSSFGDIDNRLFSGGLRLALKQRLPPGWSLLTMPLTVCCLLSLSRIIPSISIMVPLMARGVWCWLSSRIMWRLILRLHLQASKRCSPTNCREPASSRLSTRLLPRLKMTLPQT